MDDKVRSALEEFAEYVSQSSAALFVGSGISRSAGYPDWKELLEPLASGIGIDINTVSDYPALAQYIVNANAGNRSLLQNRILAKLSQIPLIKEVHRAMGEIPIETVWTTNYDTTLETCYKDKFPDVKVGDSSLLTKPRMAGVTIYKMHGTISPHPSDMVITQDDYEQYSLKYPLLSQRLAADLSSKSFLFVGFSFDDPNVRHVFAHLRALLRGNTRTHYFVYKAEPTVTKKNELWLHNLQRYGIVGLPIKTFDEIPDLFRVIRRFAFRQSVLVTGSHDGTEYEEFCGTLGRALAERRTIIISGEGRNITTFISEGAFNYLVDHGQDHTHWIHLYRIPQFARRHRNQRYRLFYRRMMTDRARVAIVVAGSAGTKEEVGLCRDAAIPIIPLGWTGGTAAETWSELAAGGFPFMSTLLHKDEIDFLNKKPKPEEYNTYTTRISEIAVRLLKPS